MIVRLKEIEGMDYHTRLTTTYKYTPVCIVDRLVPYVPLYAWAILNSLSIKVVLLDTTLIRPGMLVCNVTHDDAGNVGMLVQVGGEFDQYTWMSIIEHELIHVGQVTDGRLRISPNGLMWDGMLYPEARILPGVSISTDMIDFRDGFVDMLRYFSQPWECEANAHCWELMFTNKADTIREVLKINNVLWCEDWDRETFKDVLSEKGLRSAYRAMGVKLGDKTCT